jgi:hypothetical protein
MEGISGSVSYATEPRIISGFARSRSQQPAGISRSRLHSDPMCEALIEPGRTVAACAGDSGIRTSRLVP